MESYIYCEKCGTLIPNGQNACPKCGTPINLKTSGIGDEDTLSSLLAAIEKQNQNDVSDDDDDIDLTIVQSIVDPKERTNTLNLPSFATSNTQPIPIIREEDERKFFIPTADEAMSRDQARQTADIPTIRPQQTQRPLTPNSELFDVPSSAQTEPDNTEELTLADIEVIKENAATPRRRRPEVTKVFDLDDIKKEDEAMDDDEDDEDVDDGSRTPLLIGIVIALVAAILAAVIIFKPFGDLFSHEDTPVSSAVETTPEPTQEPEPVPVDASIGTLTVTTGSLNVRNEPSTNGDAINTLDYGDERKVFDRRDNDGYTWYKISETEEQWIADNGSWIRFTEKAE